MLPATIPAYQFQGPGRNGQPGPRRTAGARLCAEDVVLQLRHRPCGSEFQLQHHAPWMMAFFGFAGWWQLKDDLDFSSLFGEDSHFD